MKTYVRQNKTPTEVIISYLWSTYSPMTACKLKSQKPEVKSRQLPHFRDRNLWPEMDSTNSLYDLMCEQTPEDNMASNKKFGHDNIILLMVVDFL